MDKVFQHLQADFRLSVITLLGVCALIGISPFAVYRFLDGQIVAGIVDTAILAGVLLTVGYAYTTGQTWRAGFALSIFVCIGALAVVFMQGADSLFWIYPAVMTTFFMTAPRAAVGLSILTVLVLIWQHAIFESFEQMAAFMASYLIVSACAYVFAQRSGSQQQALEGLALLDSLTGIKNRRAMDVALQHAAARAENANTSYTVVMLDLDHFKRVNDIHGHDTGDKVLIQCAQVLGDSIRDMDQLYRYGGEEFVILLHGATPNRIDGVLAHLRSRVATHVSSPSGPVTVSLGAAVLHPGEDWRQWVKRADGALYRAKSAGRNCYVIDGDDGVVPTVAAETTGGREAR